MIDRKPQTVRSIIKKETVEKKKKGVIYTFACQCGKKYSTYPALYLHFKRSHNIKINTKIQGKSCQTTQSENQRIFTYFFTGIEKQTQDFIQNPCSFEKNLRNVLEEFLKQSFSLFTLFPNLPWFICDFYRYVISLGYSENFEIVSELPKFFNSFVIYDQIVISDYKIYTQLCNILLNLGQWLYQKGYTYYTVIMEKGISISQ